MRICSRKRMTCRKSAENNWKGSYTVEAALVFSMTFFVLAALLISAFYVHDRAVIQAVTCEACSVAANFITKSERSSAITQVEKQMKENRFLGSRQISGKTASGDSEIIASWNAVYPVPGMVRSYLSGNRLQIQTRWNSKVLEPADTIRKIRGVGEFLTGGEQ